MQESPDPIALRSARDCFSLSVSQSVARAAALVQLAVLLCKWFRVLSGWCIVVQLVGIVIGFIHTTYMYI